MLPLSRMVRRPPRSHAILISCRWASSPSSAPSSKGRSFRAPTPAPSSSPSVQTSSSRPSKLPPDVQADPHSRRLLPEQRQKQWYATKLYESGRRVIYRPPSHAGIYAASYVITASCIITAGALAFSNLWAYDPSSDLSWVVRVGYRLGMITFTFIGGLAFLRPTGLISAMDLRAVDGVVKLAVQVRRPLPFLRPKEFIIPPYDFRMDRQFVQQLELPTFMEDPGHNRHNIVSRIGRAISKGLYYPFAATRRLMTLEGIMFVELRENGTRCKMDTQGKFSAVKDLESMGTIKW